MMFRVIQAAALVRRTLTDRDATARDQTAVLDNLDRQIQLANRERLRLLATIHKLRQQQRARDLETVTDHCTGR